MHKPQSRDFSFHSTTECPLGRVPLAATGKGLSDANHSNFRVYGAYALALTTAGRGVYRDASTPGAATRRTLEPGDCILVMPDLPHIYGADTGGSWEEIFIVFSGPVFDQWRNHGLFLRLFPITRLQPVDLWARRIRDACDPDPLKSVVNVQMLLAEMLALVTGHARDGRTRSDAAFLAAARSAMSANAAPDWDSISQRLGCSVSGFRKRFIRLTGEPPARFCVRQQISRAADELARGLSLQETAERCGFADPFHFSRRFKQFTGLAPSEYQRLLAARR